MLGWLGLPSCSSTSGWMVDSLVMTRVAAGVGRRAGGADSNRLWQRRRRTSPRGRSSSRNEVRGGGARTELEVIDRGAESEGVRHHPSLDQLCTHSLPNDSSFAIRYRCQRGDIRKMAPGSRPQVVRKL